MQIVVPNGASYVTQSEFNTAIALLACAQNKINVSLQSLYRNRNCKCEGLMIEVRGRTKIGL